MKSLILTVLLFFVDGERICQISPNTPSTSHPCRQHSRYDKISEEKLSCGDVCFISNFPETNKKMFFEWATGPNLKQNLLLLTIVDKRAKSHKSVIFPEIDNFEILKTNLNGTQIQALIKTNGRKALGFVDPKPNPTTTSLEFLENDKTTDVVLADPIVVIQARGKEIIKKRIGGPRNKIDEYVIAKFNKPIESVKIIGDLIRVDVDDEEKDIPLINCYMQVEVEREPICGGKIATDEAEVPAETQKSVLDKSSEENEDKIDAALEILNKKLEEKVADDDKNHGVEQVATIAQILAENAMTEKPEKVYNLSTVEDPYPTEKTEKKATVRMTADSRTEKSSNTLLLIVVAGLILALLVIICCCTRRLYTRAKDFDPDSEPPKIGEGSSFQPSATPSTKPTGVVTLKSDSGKVQRPETLPLKKA